MANTKKKEKAEKVIPMHFCIEEKDVEKQFDCDSFCLYKAGGFMHYMTKGGYHVFVKPDYKSLYDTLEILLDVLIDGKDKKGEEKENLQNIADFVSAILFAPTIIFSNEEFMFKAFETVQKFTEELMNKSMETLQKEDFDANNDFESAVKSAEELVDNLKGIADALPEENKEQ